MKRLLPVFLSLLLALSLTACGGSNGAASDSMSSSGAMNQGNMKEDMFVENDMAADAGGWEEAPESVTTDSTTTESSGNVLENAKIIYTGELYLETKTFDEASQALDQIVASLGGYYESRNLNQGGTYRSLYATVRVPAKHFSTFLEQAGQAAHVTDRYEEKQNISEAYYDVESRLTTQRTKLERLQELLRKAESMEDIITLETAISDTELAIEHLTGSLRKYDNLVDFSTITLSLHEVYRLSTDEAPVQTFGQRLSKALSTGLERGIDDLEDFVISIARNWMTLLMLAILATGGVLVIRRWRRRRPLGSKFSKVPEKSENSEEK